MGQLLNLRNLPTKEEAITALHSAKRSLLSIREKAEAGMEKAMHGVEVTGASFGVSYLMAAGTLPQTIGGYDTDLALGVALVAAGIFGVAGKHSDHLFYLGLGTASAFGAREGTAKGQASLTQP